MGVCQTVYHYSNIDSNSDHTGEESEVEFLNFDHNFDIDTVFNTLFYSYIIWHLHIGLGTGTPIENRVLMDALGVKLLLITLNMEGRLVGALF